MSRKTIPFPTAVISAGAALKARQSIADSRSATDLEDWVKERNDTDGAIDLEGVAAQINPRGAVTFVLAEDANWLELLSFTLVLPYFAAWYWTNRASQRALSPYR
jgi:hypothetical protein